MTNPLRELQRYGQSVWLDYIRRNMLRSGELQKMIDEDGLTGVTSNPAIFGKAILETADYDEAIVAMARSGMSATSIYQVMAVEDVSQAADQLRHIYEHTRGGDGYVSLEVSPHLAHDTEGTIAEARELWEAVARPNVLIKVPGTKEGIPAFRTLIAEGINVNVTLLFGLDRYRDVAEAYVEALDARMHSGESIERVASVASFFLSRIDTLADPILEKLAKEGGPRAGLAAATRGEIAIASAKSAYEIYLEIFKGESFRKLAKRGAWPQRLLWASTSTKNPDYSDVKYVEPLIGPDTINTMPMETVVAYRDHGSPADRIREGCSEARELLARLPELGVDLDQMTGQLEKEGVQKFIQPFDALLSGIEKKRSLVLRATAGATVGNNP